MAAITRVKALKSFDQSEILEITACKSQRCESCEGGAKCNTRKQEEPRVMHVLTTKKILQYILPFEIISDTKFDWL